MIQQLRDLQKEAVLISSKYDSLIAEPCVLTIVVTNLVRQMAMITRPSQKPQPVAFLSGYSILVTAGCGAVD